MQFRRSLWCALLAPLLTLQPPVGYAEDYPSRPVTLVAPWPAGGAVDTLCRMLGAKLADRLGKPIIIENRPGAGSTIGVGVVAREAPDGYTLVMGGSASLASTITIYKKLPYDPTRDFTPIALIARIPFVLVVSPSLPVHSVSELIRLAKEKPDQIAYASGGPGSPHHLIAELLKSRTGIAMMHVPYKGSAPGVTDVLAGHVPLMFSDPVPALPLIREGKLLALGVSSKDRWPAAPEIAPIAELGVPGFDAVGWVMVIAPANTPAAIADRLHAEFKSIVSLPELQRQIIQLGMVPVDSLPRAELQGFINSEIVVWSKIVHQAGIAGTE